MHALLSAGLHRCAVDVKCAIHVLLIIRRASGELLLRCKLVDGTRLLSLSGVRGWLVQCDLTAGDCCPALQLADPSVYALLFAGLHRCTVEVNFAVHLLLTARATLGVTCC